MMEQIYNELLSENLIKEFEKRNMEGFYCKTKEDALRKILEIIPKNSVVSCGGSKSLLEIGLFEAMKGGEYKFLDPNNKNEKTDIPHEALGADYYLMSSNAISETGELVNMDGYGNRVSALIFGPKNVIVVAGMNKVEPNLDAAILRTKTYAARMCLLQFKQDYQSFEELSKAADDIGGQLVITSKIMNKGRIKIILAGEKLGF